MVRLLFLFVLGIFFVQLDADHLENNENFELQSNFSNQLNISSSGNDLLQNVNYTNSNQTKLVGKNQNEAILLYFNSLGFASFDFFK